MQQNKYCDIQEHCKLLCEANEKYNEALKYIGKIELEKANLKQQNEFLIFDNKNLHSINPRTATEITSSNKLKEIRKLCSENLKYRCIASGYEPTKTTKILNKIIEIIDKEN